MRPRRRGLSRGTAAAGMLGLAMAVVAATPTQAGPTEATASDDVGHSFTDRPWGQAPCPEGMSRRRTVYTNSFEDGMPWARFAHGWSSVTSSSSSGSKVARSRMTAGQSDPGEYFHLPMQQVTPGEHTRVAMASRGTMGQRRGWVTANSVRYQTSGSSSWRGVSVNITGATDDDGGWIGTYIEQRRTSGVSSVWDIDNLQMYTCRDNRTTRIFGATRYETAAAITRSYSARQPVVYVARGDAFPDALAGAALAGHEGAPLLLVEPGRVPTAAARELERLDPASIVVLGGPDAISDGVVQQLRGHSGQVRRLAGDLRWETSALVAQEFDDPDRMYLATGRDFPDALSGGALAGRDGAPVLLTDTATLPTVVADEIRRVRPSEVVILGGPNAVQPAVESQVRALGVSVRRLQGTTRYATSAAIAEAFGNGPDRSYLATGTDFADALAGSALAGHTASPLLLTEPNQIPAPVNARLTAMSERTGHVLGGQDAVAAIVRDRYGRTLP